MTLALIVALLSLLSAPFGALAASSSGDTFTDVPTSHPNYTAIIWLAQRGIAKGYGDGTFGVNDQLVRGQVAGFITRALGWQFQTWPNTFPDQGTLDNDLWRNVGTLNHYGVAQGFPDGTFRPLDNVVKAQLISFITRAMVQKGYWQQQPVAVTRPAEQHSPFLVNPIRQLAKPPDPPRQCVGVGLAVLLCCHRCCERVGAVLISPHCRVARNHRFLATNYRAAASSVHSSTVNVPAAPVRTT